MPEPLCDRQTLDGGTETTHPPSHAQAEGCLKYVANSGFIHKRSYFRIKLIVKGTIEMECRDCLPEFFPWSTTSCELPLIVYPQGLPLIEKRDL